jgi:demethylmenaquinone methyltransferase/2-methoxy-6-polyprenyl-1,4-benzoquinol methylase
MKCRLPSLFWRVPAPWATVAAMSSRPTGAGADASGTDFGFRRVPAAEKASLVRDVFDSVAPRYDLMNDLMSLGVHRLWKDAFVDWLAPRPGMAVLDVGGGTGDIAFRVLRRAAGPVTVCDINQAMLDVGRDRAVDQGILDGITWITGDAEDLPVDDASVDALTIAFCIRNVTHVDRALAEARRVLRPGGRFMCLEFSRIAVPALGRLYDAYSLRLLPTIGRVVARDADAYRYLAESIRRFPDQEAFAAMIADAGLDQVRHRNLSGGIAAIHSAWRT